MKRTTLEVIAPSIEEAISRGVEQLGVPRELLHVDVLDEGSRGFLGIGGRQVRLRLTLKAVEPAALSIEPDVEKEPLSAAPSSDDLLSKSLLAFTIQTTSDLLLKMKLKARVLARYAESEGSEDAPVVIDINGDDLSVLIGRRAETLNALQYILALIISKQANHWVQVIVDVEGYRARRERQLRQLARRMADQAVRTGKRQRTFKF